MWTAVFHYAHVRAHPCTSARSRGHLMCLHRRTPSLAEVLRRQPWTAIPSRSEAGGHSSLSDTCTVFSI
ncbi:hypothetical protein FKM82_019136 [Ascaphus truei]